MSFNLLAEDLLRKHFHLYGDCDTRSLSWERRSQMLLEEIAYWNLDIVCLQEVQNDHYASCYAPFLANRGYAAFFLPRAARTDGCAIAFKKNKFAPLDEDSFIAMVYDFGANSRDLNFGNVGQIAFLKYLGEQEETEKRNEETEASENDQLGESVLRWADQSGGDESVADGAPRSTMEADQEKQHWGFVQDGVREERIVCIANTHILFDPGRCHVKLLQVLILFHFEFIQIPFLLFLKLCIHPFAYLHSHVYDHYPRPALKYTFLLTLAP